LKLKEISVILCFSYTQIIPKKNSIQVAPVGLTGLPFVGPFFFSKTFCQVLSQVCSGRAQQPMDAQQHSTASPDWECLHLNFINSSLFFFFPFLNQQFQHPGTDSKQSHFEAVTWKACSA